VERIDVEMHDVELRGTPVNLLEHDHVIGDVAPDVRAEAKGAVHTKHQEGLSDGITGGEEGDLVAPADEFFGKERDARSVPP
jgi:hypothetical protein